jgi:hypothetical protein
VRTLNTLRDTTGKLSLIKQIEKKLSIQQPTDWYNYSPTFIIRHGGRKLLNEYKGTTAITDLLGSIYPEVQWDIKK